MPLSFCVLGSGSAGNSTLVVLGALDRHILIDAGLSPRATAKRMGPLGLEPAAVSDIVLTHLDSDHFHPGWIAAVRRFDLAVHVHRRHRNAAYARGLPIQRLHTFTDAVALGAGVRIEATLLGHDQLGSVGLVINHAGVRLGYATDLGRVPPSLLAHFQGLHGLAIESNYDRQMQDASDRPALLKRRITGGLGHLSNEQALAAVLGIADQADLRHLVLLHLSRQCNDPRLVRRLYARQAPHLLGRLTISHQFHPTPLLHVAAWGGRLAGGDRAGAPGRQLDFLEALSGA